MAVRKEYHSAEVENRLSASTAKYTECFLQHFFKAAMISQPSSGTGPWRHERLCHAGAPAGTVTMGGGPCWAYT